MELCTGCNKPLSWAMRDCPGCGEVNTAPNIRHAQRELDVLEQRYESSLSDCQTRHAASVAQDFMQTVAQDSHAVINGSASFFQTFFQDDKSLYGAYVPQARAELRMVADFENDSRRRSNEAAAFGAYGEEIRYAALSLDQRGLHSYGSCSMVLNQNICANKASVLDENSFDFVERHPRGGPLAQGYRAAWGQRQKLALAKLGNQLNATTDASHYAGLLLHCTGDRASDQFMEVHLYGPFSPQAVIAVTAPKTGRDRAERCALEIFTDILTQKGLPCQRL